MEAVCKATLQRTLPPDVQEDAIHNKAFTVCLWVTMPRVGETGTAEKRAQNVQGEERTGAKRGDAADSGGGNDW